MLRLKDRFCNRAAVFLNVVAMLGTLLFLCGDVEFQNLWQATMTLCIWRIFFMDSSLRTIVFAYYAGISQIWSFFIALLMLLYEFSMLAYLLFEGKIPDSLLVYRPYSFDTFVESALSMFALFMGNWGNITEAAVNATNAAYYFFFILFILLAVIFSNMFTGYPSPCP